MQNFCFCRNLLTKTERSKMRRVVIFTSDEILKNEFNKKKFIFMSMIRFFIEFLKYVHKYDCQMQNKE